MDGGGKDITPAIVTKASKAVILTELNIAFIIPCLQDMLLCETHSEDIVFVLPNADFWDSCNPHVSLSNVTLMDPVHAVAFEYRISKGSGTSYSKSGDAEEAISDRLNMVPMLDITCEYPRYE